MRSCIKWIALGLAGICCSAAVVLKICFPFDAALLDGYRASSVLLDRHGRPLRVKLGPDGMDNRPVDVETVSGWAAKALIAAEDRRFMSHGGVDSAAILRAACQNIFYGRRISGASTLSTQVIRLAEPRPRTIGTKIIEAVKSLQMEKVLGKEDILEQHMNRAPFGSNLTGIESASRMYFAKSSSDLSLAEAAMLMGLPQSPSRLRPDRHPSAARKRMKYVLGRMEACGYITAEQRLEAERQPLPVMMNRRPFAAPHFADMVLQKTDRTGNIRTTLDLDIQTQVEKILRTHCRALASQGVHGAAVVVMDVKTGAVRALIGSPDYFDSRHAGAVNGALAPRSPGSALKPFIYAMALEQGMITTGARILDAPMHFRDGTPVNFDGTYLGEVSVSDALVQSLNIPALKITDEVGQGRVVDTLRKLGLATLTRPAEDYGLGIALGSGEVRLLDLVNAYACIARGGLFMPCSILGDENPACRVFSPETAYMVSEMLGGAERSMDIFGHVGDARLPRIAWKTGTSSGFRDAWTVAWNPEYVVGVWLGNPDGSGSPALVGASAAAPVAGDIFRALYPSGGTVWFEKPEGVSERILADGTRDLYVPGISKTVLAAEKNAPLKIVSPVDGSVFRISDGLQMEQEIELKATGAVPGGKIHWFVNGSHVGAADSGESIYWPLKQGFWSITCASGDQTGESAIKVEI